MLVAAPDYEHRLLRLHLLGERAHLRVQLERLLDVLYSNKTRIINPLRGD